MQSMSLNVIGLMSGTSVDSVDAACVRVCMETNPLRLTNFDILGTFTLEFAPSLREALMDMMAQPDHVSLHKICELDTKIGQLFAQTALGLMETLKSGNVEVDLIASHGQTLYHLPPSGKNLGNSLQIGEPAVIAEYTGVEVAADFRPADMSSRGHGAPLVPFADILLFQDLMIDRAVHNIGGISNLTALPARCNADNKPLAFDTGPGNMLIDYLIQKLFNLPYDPAGEIAGTGKVAADMLDYLKSHPYFAIEPPKSTGREIFGNTYASSCLAIWQKQLVPEDIIATATFFVADSIADAYERFVIPKIPVKEVIVGGGGVFNITLVRFLREKLDNLGIDLKFHEDFGIPSKYKEAIAFALLGYACKMKIAANIPSCTGAKHSSILGSLWNPFKP